MDDWRSELTRLCIEELRQFGQANLIERTDHARAGLLDVLMAYRLFLGRWPEFSGVEAYRNRVGTADIAAFTKTFIESGEFRSRVGGSLDIDLVVMRQLPDMRLFFNLNDRQGLRIAAGLHEPTIQQAMRQLLKPGMNCVDAGAHIGLYTVIMAQAGGQVWSFEPLPRTYELLKQNIAANGIEKLVHPINAACHEQVGTARFYLPEVGDVGSAYVIPTGEAPPGGIMEVPMTRIDDTVPEEVRIGLVKMDIEGNEPFALRGMMRILERDRPILFSEFLPGARGIDPAGHLAWLRGKGYELYEVPQFLDGAHQSYQYRKGDPSTNLIALPR